MEITGFECCFCKNEIKENLVDPVDINIVFNKDMKEKTGCFQNFYAHFACFKEKLHEEVRGYLVCDDE